MNRVIKFRGKTYAGTWVVGYYNYDKATDTHFIAELDTLQRAEVRPETVGQLRYTNSNGDYYDGDLYYHAGYGTTIVSELGELQSALLSGDTDDIGAITGNIHDK